MTKKQDDLDRMTIDEIAYAVERRTPALIAPIESAGARGAMKQAIAEHASMFPTDFARSTERIVNGAHEFAGKLRGEAGMTDNVNNTSTTAQFGFGEARTSPETVEAVARAIIAENAKQMMIGWDRMTPEQQQTEIDMGWDLWIEEAKAAISVIHGLAQTPSIDLMQRVWANLYYNEEDAGGTFQETLNEVVDWLAARNALPAASPSPTFAEATERVVSGSYNLAEKLRGADKRQQEPVAWRYRFVTSVHGDLSDWFIVDDIRSIPSRPDQTVQPLYAALSDTSTPRKSED